MRSDAAEANLRDRWTGVVRALRGVSEELAAVRVADALICGACEKLAATGVVDACAAVFAEDDRQWARVRSWPSSEAEEVPSCLTEALRTGARTSRRCGASRCEGCRFGVGDVPRTAFALSCDGGHDARGAWLFVLTHADDAEMDLRGELLDGFVGELSRQLRWIAVDRERESALRETERERAALRQTRDQLEAVIRASPAAILTLDPGGRVLSWNPAAERMFGWTAAEAIGQPMLFVAPEKRDESRKLVQAVMAGASLMGVKVTRRRRDGTPIELSVSTAPLWGEDGKICGVMAATLDITEERRTAERLRESRRTLETLMGNLRGMVYRCANDRDWPMEFVSKGSLELTGYRPEQLIGGTGADRVTYASLIHPADAQRVWHEVQTAVASGESFALEYRIRDASGREKWVWEQGSGVFSPDGRLEALEGYIADVTPRKLAEDAARLGEARLASLFELSQKSSLSEHELIDYALEEAVRLTGSQIGYFHLVDADQMNLHLHSWSSAARRECNAPTQQHYPLDTAGIWADCARYKCPVVHENYQHLPDRKGYPEGHAHIDRHMSAPIVADGLVVAVAGVANKTTAYDETDVRQLQLFLDGLWRLMQRKRADEQRAKLEEQLRVSQKMDAIGRLASGIAHDFNNMVAAVTGYAEIVLDDMPVTDRHHADLVEIRKAGERAGMLTRQLLAFARKQVLVPEVLSLNHVVSDLERMLRRLIGEDIELWAQLDPNLGLAELDRGQLEQVVVNLVLNARDAMLAGGKLTIATSNTDLTASGAPEPPTLAPGQYVSLAVTDTGVGMDAATRSRLFEPFFTTKPEGRGIGLGLATVYGIVTQSGGGVVVTSEPGCGNTFRVLFPRVDAPSSSRGSTAPGSIPPGSETVLVVEDEDTVRGLAERVLTGVGYRVLVACTGDEAVALCEASPGPIDLMIADVVMPGMSTLALRQEVERRKPGIRVMYMSAHPHEVVQRHGVADDGPSFIAKPFSTVELIRRVRAVLDDEGRQGS